VTSVRSSRPSARDLITPAALSGTAAVFFFVTVVNAVFWVWDRLKEIVSTYSSS
jgi:hypothetical protein